MMARSQRSRRGVTHMSPIGVDFLHGTIVFKLKYKISKLKYENMKIWKHGKYSASASASASYKKL